jgi:hypothetical protein
MNFICPETREEFLKRRAKEVAEVDKEICERFEQLWSSELSAPQRPLQRPDEHLKEMCFIAFSNGAYAGDEICKRNLLADIKRKTSELK